MIGTVYTSQDRLKAKSLVSRQNADQASGLLPHYTSQHMIKVFIFTEDIFSYFQDLVSVISCWQDQPLITIWIGRLWIT